MSKLEAWRGVLVRAWFDTRMERDRGVLHLSGGGAGLLTALLITGQIETLHGRILAAVSLAGFVIAIFASLCVFHGNAGYIERMIEADDEVQTALLRFFDWWLVGGFVVGVAGVLVLVVTLLLNPMPT